MRQVLIIFVALFYLLSSSNAGEVDPFYATDKIILDAKDSINKYLNTAIIDTIKQYNKEDASCRDVSLHIMKTLGTTDYLVFTIGALNSDFELWVKNNIEIDRIPKYGHDNAIFTAKSIYAPQLKFFHIYSKDLDATININNIYFGIDKLSHFLGSGYEYYKRYLKEKESTSSDFLADYSAIKWGTEMENTILGGWSVGIVSYADLEANFQGFKMAKDFCDKSHLIYQEKKWQLVKEIRVQDYVTPNWDESYNPNSYTESRESEVRRNIKEIGICQKVNWKQFHKRFKLYNEKSKFLRFNLSQEIFATFSTDTQSAKQAIYEKIRKHYQLKKSNDYFDNLFNELKTANKAYSLDSYCN